MCGRFSDSRCDSVKKKSVISVCLIIVLFSVVLLSSGCSGEKFDIKCDSFVIYDTSAPPDILTEEELQKYVAGVTSYQAAQEEINCLYSAEQRDDLVLWKGDKLGVLTTADGEQIQIRISLYGGFFAPVDSDEYYVINNSHLSMWNNMISVNTH